MAVKMPIGMDKMDARAVWTKVPTMAWAAPPPSALFITPRWDSVHQSAEKITPLPREISSQRTQIKGTIANAIAAHTTTVAILLAALREPEISRKVAPPAEAGL